MSKQGDTNIFHFLFFLTNFILLFFLTFDEKNINNMILLFYKTKKHIEPDLTSDFQCVVNSGREIRTLDTTGMNRVLWPTELFRHMKLFDKRFVYQWDLQGSNL